MISFPSIFSLKNLFLLGFVLLSACSPKFKIGSEQDPEVSLTKYENFALDQRKLFTRRSNAFLNSDLTEKRINYTIKEVLLEKGYSEDPKKADFLFSFQTEVRQRQDIQNANNNNAFNNWGYWSRWYNPQFNQTYVRDYEETTLIIDIKDAKTRELVWQGWVIGELKYSVEDWQKKIEKTVRKAMGEFPAKNLNN